jgi:phage-related protein
MENVRPIKPIFWVGSSLEDLKKMPEAVRKEVGHSLREIQKGRNPGNIKLLRHLGETGISEIVVDERGGTFRAVYTVEFKSLIAVLHVFQKKSKSGIATPRNEIELVLRRLLQAREQCREEKL